MLMVHAMLLAAPNAPMLTYQCCPNDHAATPQRLSNGAVGSTPPLRALPALAHAFSAAIVQPLLNRMKRAVFDPNATAPPLELMDLCSELRFAILSLVQDPSDLCHAGASCTALRDLAYDDLLWCRHHEAHFGSEGLPSPSSTPAFVAFRRAYTQARRAAQEAERQAEARTRAHAMRMPPPTYLGGGLVPGLYGGGGGDRMPPGAPQGIGMLGGDYDRLPGFGSVPPPFGPSPFATGGGEGMMPMLPGGPGDGPLPYGSVPPGARFDPISPLIDQDGMHGVGGVPMGRGRGRAGGRMPGRGGFPRGGGGFPGGFPGGGWDPDGPDLPGML